MSLQQTASFLRTGAMEQLKQLTLPECLVSKYEEEAARCLLSDLDVSLNYYVWGQKTKWHCFRRHLKAPPPQRWR